MSSTNKIKVLEKQSLFDIAAIYFGNSDCVFDILRLNPNLGLESDPPAGTEIILPAISDLKSGDFMPGLQSYLFGRNIATGISGQPLGDFSNDFNEDFLI